MRKAFSPLSEDEKSVTRNPRKLPALREDVGDQAPEKRQVFLLLFFVLRRAIEIGPNLPRKPLVGQGLPLPRRRAHSALQRGTWGALCVLC